MKLCWDNLEGMRLTGSGYLRKGSNIYIEMEGCEVCGQPYLAVRDRGTTCCSKSCGQLKDLIGQRFGRLIVVRLLGININAYWLCICDCGNTCSVIRGALIAGYTKSCGCLRKEVTAKLKYTHGMCGTKAYANKQSNKKRAMKLNQTPDNANQDKIMLYYKVCAYLNEPHNKPMWNVDHIQPLHKGGLHHEDNLQVLDAKLNRQKSDKWPLSEKEMIKYKGVRI